MLCVRSSPHAALKTHQEWVWEHNKMAAAARPVRLLLREDGAEKLRVGLCAHDLVVLVDVALRRGKVFEREHHLCTHTYT